MIFNYLKKKIKAFFTNFTGHGFFTSSITSTVEYSYTGRVYNISVEDDETYIANGIVVHNCRSIRVPLLEGESAEVGRYEDWLKRQPNSVQNEILGKERAELFRANELTVKQFTNDGGVEYTLDELEQKYDIEVLE